MTFQERKSGFLMLMTVHSFYPTHELRLDLSLGRCQTTPLLPPAAAFG